MWIIIILILLILILPKLFKKEKIIVSLWGEHKFLLEFKSGKKDIFELIDVFEINGTEYYAFVLDESLKLKNIPDCDLLILKYISKKGQDTICAFAEKDIDEKIYKIILEKYKNKYHFVV